MIARTIIQPVLIQELKELQSVADLAKALTRTRDQLIQGIEMMAEKADRLEELIQLKKYEDYVFAMNDLRSVVDALEKIVSDENWPLPKYREMLFLY